MLTIPVTYLELPISKEQRPKRYLKKPSEKSMDRYLRKIERQFENEKKRNN